MFRNIVIASFGLVGYLTFTIYKNIELTKYNQKQLLWMNKNLLLINPPPTTIERSYLDEITDQYINYNSKPSYARYLFAPPKVDWKNLPMDDNFKEYVKILNKSR